MLSDHRLKANMEGTYQDNYMQSLSKHSTGILTSEILLSLHQMLCIQNILGVKKVRLG